MTTKQTITFQVPLPPSGLRANRRARDHGYRASLVREYQEQVWCVGAQAMDEQHSGTPMLGRPWARAKVHYEWHSTHQVDEDNAIASMKAALDVIKSTGPRPLGIIEDDSGAVISATWVKVSNRKDECVVVEITRLEEP